MLLTTPQGRGLGYRRDSLDMRDRRLASAPAPADAPNYIDLRHSGFEPAIYDQGRLGSCTGNAIGAAMQYARARQGLPHSELVPSRLMIYYGERELEGTVASDAGAEIRDGIKFMALTGACFEDLWPYDVTKFKMRPPSSAYAAAHNDMAISYARVPQTVDGIRTSLAQGWPVIFGFTCYPALDSPEMAREGRLPMPNSFERPIGGHAVLLIGCDIDNRTVLIRNSWSGNWGFKGHFLMPLEYILNPELANDLWQISSVSA